MKRLALLLAGALLAQHAFGDTPQDCQENMAGKISCIAGVRMLCNKEFDASMHDFRYEWHAVNSLGQTFDVYSPYYGKLPGYTPAACSAAEAAPAAQ